MRRFAIRPLVALFLLSSGLFVVACGFDPGLAPPAPLCVNGAKDGAETDVDCGATCAPCADGKACASGDDCASGSCAGGRCGAASCADGVRNGAESDVDCGGDACSACAAGQRCASGADCASAYCAGATCAMPTCEDGVKNGTESDVDCGGDTCALCNDGQACDQGTSCASGVCVASLCAPATCRDGVLNGAESAVDCGGGCPCPDGSPCSVPEQCESLVCSGGTCKPAACDDGVKNGGEGDTDCGGGCAPCADGKACGVAAGCVSGVCEMSVCKAPTCSDGAKNASETDVDCGGPCASCGVAKSCLTASDCTSGICNALVCASPSCSDGLENGSETGVDCGGGCPSCATGLGCSQASDCQSGVCGGVPKTCKVPTCTDQVKNGPETDIDCGSASCPKCQDLKGCSGAADCESGVCTQGLCQVPGCNDAVKNGSETDIDCGGGCVGCVNGGACSSVADCVSGACAAGQCAPWSKAFADTAYYGKAIDVDGAGNVVATFIQQSPTNVGGGSALSAGLFVAKYDRTGGHAWSKSYAAPTPGQYAIRTDAAGSVMFTAPTFGANFGGGQLTGAGGIDMAVVKLTAQGVHVWSHLYGGPLDDSAPTAAVDGAGDIFIAGSFESPVLDFGGGVAIPRGTAGVATAFVAKLDGASGGAIWAKAFGGAAAGAIEIARAKGVAVDAAGDVFVSGLFFGTIDLGGGTLSNPLGANAAFVAKLTGSSGAHVWSRSFFNAGASGIAVDGAGQVVVTGTAYGGVDFGGGALLGGPENLDVFLVKLSGQDGSHVWSKLFPGTYIIGPSLEASPTVAVDATGNAVLAGGFAQATADFGAKTVTNASPGAGTVDAFVASFDGATGTALSAKAFGAANDDWTEGLAVDEATGNVALIGGFSQSIDLGAGPHTVGSPFGVFLTSLGPP